MPGEASPPTTLRGETSVFHAAPDVLRIVGDHLCLGSSEIPGHAFVGGTRGAGKTTLLNDVERRVTTAAEHADRDVAVVRIDCPQDMSSTDIFRALLRACGRPAPTRRSAFHLGRRVRDHCRDFDIVLLLIDDIHHVTDLQPFFGFLCTLRTFEPATVNSLSTHASATLFEDIDDRTVAKLNGIHTVLPAPGKSACRTILTRRIEAVLGAEAVTQAAIESLAHRIAEGFGNLHAGLELLELAVDIAAEANHSVVSIADIAAALDQYRRELAVQRYLERDASLHEQAILRVLAAAAPGEALSTTQAHDRYSTVMDSTSEAPLSQRRFRERFNRLQVPGVSTVAKTEQEDDPAHWEATLDCAPQIMETALDRYGDLPQSTDESPRASQASN